MPELLPNPKGEMTSLAARSKRKLVREGMAPRVGSGKKVGPLYTQMLRDFVANHWDVDRAMVGAGSLARAVAALSQLIE